MCTGEPIEQLEAELKEAQLQILHLEHLLGTAGLADDGHGHSHNGHGQGAEEGGGGEVDCGGGQLENGWRDAMRAVRRRRGDGIWHRKYQEIETVL